MPVNPKKLNRRRFLHCTAPVLGLGVAGLVRLPTIQAFSEVTDREDEMRNRLLDLVNGERFVAGVRSLELNELASRVATAHAKQMASEGFLSHWSLDGRKPYHRYSFAGGTDATQENVASIDNLRSTEWKDVVRQLEYLHITMHGETPPHDGHRRAILAPQQTHVGFGFSVSERRLRLVETYVAKYVKFSAFESQISRKARFELSGQLLDRSCVLQQVDVFYEPPLVPPDESFLATSRSYSFPDEYRTLRPRLPDNVFYADRTAGTIDVRYGGYFRVPVKLFKSNPGVYTIVFWIKRNREKAFPAAEICIEAK